MPFDSTNNPERRKSAETSAGAKAVPIKLLFAGAVGAVVFLAVSAFGSFVALKADAPPDSAALIARICAAIAAFAAGFAAARPTRQKGLLTGLAAAVPLIAVIMGVSMLADRASSGKDMLILAAIALPCAALGGIAAANMRKKQGKH